MKFNATPIQRQLMRVILLITAIVLILTCIAFFTYDFISFRSTTKTQMSTLGAIIAANSTAALAFDSRDDAREILDALKVEKRVVAACLYDGKGQIFSKYPAAISVDNFPIRPAKDGFYFYRNHLVGFEPVVQNDKRLGTIYLDADMDVIYTRFQRYGLIGGLVIIISLLLAYFLSFRLQKSVTDPILALAETARLVSERHDYSVRARSSNVAELRLLTSAFNHMLAQIEAQNREIISFNQNLEHKVSARTRELENAKEELETVNNKLIKSNLDLEQFAYIASHDLQEPLRKIITFTELTQKHLNDETIARKYFNKISSSANRMSDLIQAVLNYSRLSNTGEEFSAVDLNIILENIKIDFELMISEKDALIQSSSLPTIRGIPLQIHQLFLNLISNSLKFSRQRPIITIKCEILAGYEIDAGIGLNKDQTYLWLIFKDNGIGFEPQYADSIFTIFQRLHGRQEFAGTGIGLALCKKIVENHQGAISVKSELGKGAEFSVYLPMEAQLPFSATGSKYRP